MTTVLPQVADRRPELSARIARALEWPMAVLALAVIPALLLDDGASTPRVHAIAIVVNWVVWLAFGAEFLLRLAVAPSRPAFLRSDWLGPLLIVVSPPFAVPEALQGLRALRAVRLLRLLRLVRAAAFLSIGLRATRRVLRHHQFHYVLAVTLAMMVLGATGIYVMEGGRNEGLTGFGDALWWAVSTTTTVGYGDIYPATVEGRLIAIVLMLTGIGVIGVFTGSIASLFMIEEEVGEFDEVKRRLDAIEAKLDAMMADRSSSRWDTRE